MTSIIKSLIEKFNEQSGRETVKLIGDDGDSFRVEFEKEDDLESFKNLVKNATKKTIIAESMENIFGNKYLVRIFFEKPVSADIVSILKNYEEGTPFRKVECCGDGCHPNH